MAKKDLDTDNNVLKAWGGGRSGVEGVHGGKRGAKKGKKDLASVLTIIVTGRTAEWKPLRRTE